MPLHFIMSSFIPPFVFLFFTPTPSNGDQDSLVTQKGKEGMIYFFKIIAQAHPFQSPFDNGGMSNCD